MNAVASRSESALIQVLHEPVLGFVGAGGLHVRTRDFRAEGEAAEFLAPTETRTAAL